MLASLWGYMSDTPSTSKQVSAVLPQGEEVRRYKNKTIKKRPDGRYWARYYKDGKQCCVYGRTVDECLSALKQALAGKPKKQKEPSKQMTLAEWLEKWLELYKVGKVKASTLEQMRRYLRDISTKIATKAVKKITAIDLQEFLNGVERPRKREKLYTFLKDAFTRATKTKVIADNPFDAIDKPRHEKKQSRALTHEEETRFVDACQQSNYGALYLLCLYQGLRLGEALALTYEDINFDEMTLTINKSIDSLGKLTTPKTATSNRTIPLFKRSLAVLRRDTTGKVFPYTRKGYQVAMLRICKKLNLPGVSVHTLRHTFATRCSEAGIAAKTVQKWLGHSSINMTLNVYTHVNADFERKETVKIDTYFDTQNF
ncbi:MAG: site-specific integrase [Clostridia bacterium]|nr:site-specific integrase [Clostridia bacterium]